MSRSQSNFSQNDRMGLTVFGSSLMHLVLILGVSFVAPEAIPKLNDLPVLDIVLVNSRTEEAPEEADFLAQANLDGGGESEKAERPSSPLPLASGVAGRPVNAGPETSKGDQTETFVAALDSLNATAEDADLVLEQAQPEKEQSVEIQPNPTAAPVSEANRLSAELREMLEAYQKRPRRKFLSGRTRESKYAEYMEAWRNKVELIGNQNYPDEARRRKLSGQVMLNVAIKPNGALENVSISKPSGFRVLDNAALAMVEMAAPYQPFPNSISKEVDILHITRTFEFLRNYRLTSH